MKNKLCAKRSWELIGIICIVMAMFTSVGVGADEVSDVDLKIERVALFKNGLGYITSSTNLPKGATTIKINQLPIPSHGTFWVGYPKDVKINKLVTGKGTKEVEGTNYARSLIDLLQINTDRNVIINDSRADVPPIIGTLVKVMPGNGIDNSNSLVVIRTEEGTIALNAGSINRVDFDGDTIATSVPYVSTKSTRPSIRIELDEAANGQEIGVSYLARGITWSPSYLIDISDSKKARFSAKAIVINEVEDLEDIHLDLVTGFPNIKYADVNSPIAMSESLTGFIQALISGRSASSGRSGGHNGVLSQMAGLYIRGGRSAPSDVVSIMPSPDYSTAQTGTVSEDLFLYPVKDFTLLKGETATIPLFTVDVPYKHVYIWKIPEVLDKDGYHLSERKEAEEVWHSCRLDNNMEMPWTTATAEFVKDGQFTGQDICYYTAPGTETTIRINRAMNIIAEEGEFEVERQRNATKIYGYGYDLVKIKGELKLSNRLDKSVIVEVTKAISGELVESIPEAEDILTANKLQRVNPRHILMWDVELEPDQETTLSYTYELYVRI